MEGEFTHEDLAALNAALTAGKRRVRYRDREVEYQTTKDMLALRETMRRELSASNGPRVMTTRATWGGK